MAVAMPVLRPKQSAKFAATLNSPPLTWSPHSVALRKGVTPGSSRYTIAPSDKKSRWPLSEILNPYFIAATLRRNRENVSPKIAPPLGARTYLEEIATGAQDVPRSALSSSWLRCLEMKAKLNEFMAGMKRQTTMKTRTVLAGGMAAIGLLAGCESFPPGAERGPDGTMAYLVQIEASDPDVKIEANGQPVGTAPMTLKIFGDTDGTFHDFGSYYYIVRAFPARTNQFVQTRVFRTGRWFTPEDRVPTKIYFDMNQPPPPYPTDYYGPPYYYYGPPAYYGPRFYFGPPVYYHRWRGW